MPDINIAVDDRSLIEAVDKVDKEVFESAPWGIDDLTANVDNSYDKLISVVDQQGELCGYAILRVLGDAEILRIGVADKFRRRGYASMLMRRMLEIAGEEKAEKLLLEVRTGNTAAIALYRSFGFKDVAIRKAYYSKPTEDALIMESEIERNN